MARNRRDRALSVVVCLLPESTGNLLHFAVLNALVAPITVKLQIDS